MNGKERSMGSRGWSRRSVLGAGAAALAFAPGASFAARKLGANDRVNVAAIGAGGMGASNMAALTGENIVALADPDFEHVARSLLDNDGNLREDRAALKDAYEKAEQYTDYRRMFDKQKDIDAVVIATPDHHHAVAAKIAMERGIHVYVQKPLTYSVREGRVLLDLARDKKSLITQMGNQGHSGADGRRVVEVIRGGAIGKVKEVHVWTNRPIWPQGIPKPDAIPAPASLDWDVWLGPANVDWGYHPDYAHFNWRGWAPFGTGSLGDMGAHLLDFPLWALEPGLPTRVETRHTLWGGDNNPWDAKGPDELTSFPLAAVTHYEFGNAPGGPLPLTWYDAGLMPPTPKDMPADVWMDPNGGVLFIGETGMLMHETYGSNPVYIGEGVAERAAAVPESLPRIKDDMGGHERNWTDAIRGLQQASSPFETAVPLNETMMLGMVALKAEQPIEYDGEAARITNSDAANQFLDREYRKGWKL